MNVGSIRRAIQSIGTNFSRQMSSVVAPLKTSVYHADKDAPVILLPAKKFFEELTPKQQKYAHYFSKASHWGTKAVLRSVSPESEGIFDLILLVHKKVGADYNSLKKTAGDEAVKGYLQYSSQFLGNLGNYKSFGDVKFIPYITPDQFSSVIANVDDDEVSVLYDKVKGPIFELTEESALLGWPENGHVSSYYLNLISKTEVDAITDVLNKHGIRPENTRNERVSDSQFKVHVASSLTSNKAGYPEEIKFKVDGKDAVLTFQFGDHSDEFKHIVDNLKDAQKYAENETQVKMLQHYINSFETGSMEEHVQSQIEWVKDLGPAVETNIGFIETYRAPDGTKGEWEGLVAMVNKTRTERFQTLVGNAKKFITLLPWSTEYEKDVFQAPDFTSLEVLTFAGSGIPAGINIPNYDTVRINIGFKNVSLGNVLTAKSKLSLTSFVESHLQADFDKYSDEAFEVQVGIHELLGHGTGKLMMQTGEDEYNFDKKNPPLGVDGKPITTFYKLNETWSSLFGSSAGTMEECRAESVAMYLVTNRELLSIFGFTDKETQDKIIEIAFLQMVRAGLIGLEFWDPKSHKWGQPHVQARHAIMRVFMEANDSFVKLEYTKEDFSDLTIKMDASQIETTGHKAIGEFLHKLHIYKCSGDVINGTKWYNDITTVGPELAKFRDVVLSKKLPRRQLIQSNTFIQDDKTVLKEYEGTEVEMIQSFADRFD